MTGLEIVFGILLFMTTGALVAFTIYHFIKIGKMKCPPPPACPACPRGTFVGFEYKTNDPVVRELMTRIQKVFSSLQTATCVEIKRNLVFMRQAIEQAAKESEAQAAAVAEEGAKAPEPMSCDEAKKEMDRGLLQVQSDIVIENPTIDPKEFIDALRRLVHYTIEQSCTNNKIDAVKFGRLMTGMLDSICFS